MEIRQLNPNDAKQYQKLRLEGLQKDPVAFASSYEEEKEYTIETYTNRLKSPEVYTFGAFENEQLFGIVTLVRETKQKTRHKANIFAMYVSSEKRGRGMARSLMEAVIQKAKELGGVEQINLTVVSTNETAKKLYYSCGFKTFGLEKNSEKVGKTYYDEEYMVLFL
ncbi:GNAT family N-acetyltransferase [Bacillus sp. MUM 116]|uniref:GNAT family N-acetyltransferase n=1 Tax=Bacillus sp. MUM 116 TaxID=1678002 RepID=UPI0008F560A6|nr:GNAT family N-acetyltransferase [Bacillus sp. MUM 116]OIK09712.1 GNAT family N-acetyltransferase [Bacillus sp. MUM 116]